MRETRAHARHEAATHVNTSAAAGLHEGLSTRQVFLLTSFKERALSAASQAGMVNNLNDGLAWGVFPLFFASYGLPVGRIGVLAALYPAVWGIGQLATGALSDRVGRKWLIAWGMWTQAVAIGLIAASHSFGPWAAVGDVAHPRWRASSVGVYRLWRDGGFAVGALLAGVVADLLGLAAVVSFTFPMTTDVYMNNLDRVARFHADVDLVERFASFLDTLQEYPQHVSPPLDYYKSLQDTLRGGRRTSPCIFRRGGFFIEPTGNVLPCWRSAELSFGSVAEQPFKEIWTGERRRRVLETIEERFCHNCPSPLLCRLQV